MATPARTPATPETVVLVQRGAARVLEAARRLERIRPLWVLLTLVAVEWAAVIALARIVVHNGWIYYQGGDQLWYYTSAWLVVHGHMPLALVGGGWSVVLAPFAAIFGPNLAQALPAIVVVQFLILVPAGVLAAYGIGERLGGRLFGYWVATAWIAVPFVGIPYTNTGYHQRYTEVTLPQGLGLTAMADFPSLVLLTVSAYFVLRTLDGGDLWDGLAAGLAGGFAIAIKPSSALYLGGLALALAWARRWRGAVAIGAGLAPAFVGLAVWKWAGYGYVPLLHSSSLGSVRLAAGSGGAPPLGFLGINQYIHLDWNHLDMQLLSLRGHFFSVRLVEWLAFAGVIALARRSRPAALLFGGWFWAVVIVKGTYPAASVDDSSLLRIMLTAAPAFVLLIAAVPLLLPGVPRRLPRTEPRPWGTLRVRTGVVAAAVFVSGVVPTALAAAATPLRDTQDIARVVENDVPIPVDTSIHLTAHSTGGAVELSWNVQHPSAGQIFYRILREPAARKPDCTIYVGRAANCVLKVDYAGAVRGGSFVDQPGAGRWVYRVAPSANWRNDTTLGDAYVLSPPVTVSVRP